jgi:hypothetical protein
MLVRGDDGMFFVISMTEFSIYAFSQAMLSP